MCCRFGSSGGGWSGREGACSGCGTGPRRRSAPWSQRSHRRDLDRLAVAPTGAASARPRPGSRSAHHPRSRQLRRGCPYRASARCQRRRCTRTTSASLAPDRHCQDERRFGTRQPQERSHVRDGYELGNRCTAVDLVWRGTSLAMHMSVDLLRRTQGRLLKAHASPGIAPPAPRRTAVP